MDQEIGSWAGSRGKASISIQMGTSTLESGLTTREMVQEYTLTKLMGAR